MYLSIVLIDGWLKVKLSVEILNDLIAQYFLFCLWQGEIAVAWHYSKMNIVHYKLQIARKMNCAHLRTNLTHFTHCHITFYWMFRPKILDAQNKKLQTNRNRWIGRWNRNFVGNVVRARSCVNIKFKDSFNGLDWKRHRLNRVHVSKFHDTRRCYKNSLNNSRHFPVRSEQTKTI